MEELSTSQMFVCVYKVNIAGSKASLNRISDYDKFKNFSIYDRDWAAMLSAKLASGYNEVTAPDLNEEITVIANAP